MTNEQTVTLLRRNKRAQVAALQAGGFSVSEATRAADFAKYVKWGAGLLDATIYAVRISDGQKFYFTAEEWGELSFAERNLFVRGGVRVRAHCKAFILSPDRPNAMTWTAATDYIATYKAHTDADGIEDALVWQMPDKELMKIVQRHIDEINAVFVAGWSSDNTLPNAIHWTCDQNGANAAYYVGINTAPSGWFIYSQNIGTATRFRPVSILEV